MTEEPIVSTDNTTQEEDELFRQLETPQDEQPSEEAEAVEEEEKEQVQSEQPATDDNADVIELVGQFFAENDIVPLEEGEIKTPEQLRHAIFSGVLKQIAQTLPEDAKQFLSYALRGVSLEEYVSTVYDLNYNIATEEGQSEVLYHFYKETTSLSDDKIKRLVEVARQNETLEEEAKEALQALNDLREKKLEEMEKQRAEEQKRRAEALEQAIQAHVEEPLRPKVQAFFFAPITTKDGGHTTAFAKTIHDIAQNPTHLVDLARLLMDYDAQKGFNFSRFEKKAADQAASKLAKMLSSSKEKKPAEVKKANAAEAEAGFFEQWLNLHL